MHPTLGMEDGCPSIEGPRGVSRDRESIWPPRMAERGPARRVSFLGARSEIQFEKGVASSPGRGLNNTSNRRITIEGIVKIPPDLQVLSSMAHQGHC